MPIEKFITFYLFKFCWDYLRGVMVKVMGIGIVLSEYRTLVALLYVLSDKYHWEMYEPPYPTIYGLNSNTTFF